MGVLNCLSCADDGRALTFSVSTPAGGGGSVLAVYVYRPQVPAQESPRPYLHPAFTLAGTPVTGFRPADHPWHHGLSLALPFVGATNLWGGPTWVAERCTYVPLANNGSMRHRGFDSAGPDAFTQHLSWHDHDGTQIADELRTLRFGVVEDAWWLRWRSRVSVTGTSPLTFGSPATHGRADAGYAGIFWRAPQSFLGARVHVEGASEPASGEELLGTRSRFMAYVGGGGEAPVATVVMADDVTTGRPVAPPAQWFSRSVEYPGFGPAPFFSQELVLAPGEVLDLACRVVVADGQDERVWRGALTR